MRLFREMREDASAAVSAASKAALAVSKVSRRLDVIEERLKALEDAVNEEQSQKLRKEKEFIDGMYGILNYDVGAAKRAKGRELNE